METGVGQRGRGQRVASHTHAGSSASASCVDPREGGGGGPPSAEIGGRGRVAEVDHRHGALLAAVKALSGPAGRGAGCGGDGGTVSIAPGIAPRQGKDSILPGEQCREQDTAAQPTVAAPGGGRARTAGSSEDGSDEGVLEGLPRKLRKLNTKHVPPGMVGGGAFGPFVFASSLCLCNLGQCFVQPHFLTNASFGRIVTYSYLS